MCDILHFTHLHFVIFLVFVFRCSHCWPLFRNHIRRKLSERSQCLGHCAGRCMFLSDAPYITDYWQAAHIQCETFVQGETSFSFQNKYVGEP